MAQSSIARHFNDIKACPASARDVADAGSHSFVNPATDGGGMQGVKFMKKIAFMAVASVLAMSAPAQAAKFLITYTGTVRSGFDLTGEIGAANTDLTGLSYVARYTLDTSVVAIFSSNAIQSYAIDIGNKSLLTADITIDGKTFSINGSYIGYVEQTNNDSSNFDLVAHVSEDSIEDSQIKYAIRLDSTIIGRSINIVNSSDYTQILNFNAQLSGVPLNSRFGNFYITELDKITGINRRQVVAVLNPNTITIAPLNAVAVVPEPATWAMMIAGFGIVGGAMRKTSRRRRSETSPTQDSKRSSIQPPMAVAYGGYWS